MEEADQIEMGSQWMTNSAREHGQWEQEKGAEHARNSEQGERPYQLRPKDMSGWMTR